MAEVPTEALEAAARALHEHDQEVTAQHRDSWMGWDDLTDDERASYESAIGDVLTAAAPHLIAEGRRQAAEAIRAEAQREIETQGSWFWFVHGESRLESGGDWAARIAAEGTDHG